LQATLGAYIARRRGDWRVHPYLSLSVKLRKDWYPIADVCIYGEEDFEGRYPEVPPVLWVDFLSHDDRMVDVLAKANELVANGVPYVWIIDPNTLESQLHTAEGVVAVRDHTLRLPDSPIEIPLDEVVPE
jgi:Uma2 family endonuclease